MTLTAEQISNLIEKYCDRVVGEMHSDDMAQMLYEMMVDSFCCASENEMEELICAVYDEDYYNELVEEVTAEVGHRWPVGE